jgi:hypothetical protein
LGPKGAAGKLKDRRMEHAGDAPYPSGHRKKGIDALQTLLARKVAALEDTESFPLEARQAAVREMREKIARLPQPHRYQKRKGKLRREDCPRGLE